MENNKDELGVDGFGPINDDYNLEVKIPKSLTGYPAWVFNPNIQGLTGDYGKASMFDERKLEPQIYRPAIVPKPKWGKGGEEIWLGNLEKENYCGKILKFPKGCRLSLHFHKIKDEIQHIYEGHGILRYFDYENGVEKEQELNAGDCVRLKPGVMHQYEALQDTIMFEISSFHRNEDSYRIRR